MLRACQSAANPILSGPHTSAMASGTTVVITTLEGRIVELHGRRADLAR